MFKTKSTFRSVCVLVPTLCLSVLTGCSEDGPGTSDSMVSTSESSAENGGVDGGQGAVHDSGINVMPPPGNTPADAASSATVPVEPMKDTGGRGSVVAPPQPAPSPSGQTGSDAAVQGTSPIPSTPNGDMAVAGGPGTGPNGVLWTTQDFCFGDNQFGARKISIADGKAVLVEPDLSDLVPAPSGRWYTYSRYNADAHRTTVTVVDPDSLVVLYEKSLPDLLFGLIPHPVHKHIQLGALSPDQQQVTNFVIVDLEKGEIVQRIEPAGAIDWMPDGHYLRMTADGRRWTGALGEEERELGSMELPTGYSAGFGFWTSPDNKQLVIQLQRKAEGAWSDDLWIGSMNGGPLERLTRTTMTSYAVWSPDSRYIAFNVDPDIHAACGINFSPERWHQNARVFYVEAGARDVAQPSDAHVFPPLGNSIKLRLLGWTEH